MGIRSLSAASISTGAKRSKFWDQSSVLVPDAYESIASVLVGAGGATSITFTDGGAWAPYKHLQLRILARSDRGISTDTIILGFNNNTTSSNYACGSYYADGASVTSFYESTSAPNSFTGIRTATIPAATAQGTVFGGQTINILDFANANKKPSARGQGGYTTNNNSGKEVILWGGLYNSTGAVSSIKVYPYGGSTLVQHSRVSLYGIRGS